MLQSASPEDTLLPPMETSSNSMESNLWQEERPQSIDDTPRSKTACTLAALQVDSLDYTPSPMPLRRRLQNCTGLQQAVIVEDDCDVICIDC
jgi:hypothetical protein